MTQETKLALLKIDLQISASDYDAFLQATLDAAADAIEIEGINVDPTSVSDGMLVVQYASWLYRKRKENVPMSRMLRWQLNNRLLSEKARTEE